jgi:hypothetical protein
MKFLTTLLLTALPLLATEPDSFGANLYWPGDFEARFEGGIFGSKRGTVISAGPNRTPGGKQSWEIVEGYQHLELLVPSHRKGIITFYALATQPQTMVLKVVDPIPDVAVTPENPVRSHDQFIEIAASSEWKKYEIPIETHNSWPKPPVSEILLTFYNYEDKGSVRIDDLEVRMTPDPPQTAGTAPAVPPLADTACFHDLTYGPEAPATALAHRPLDLTSILGKRIRLSADVTFLSMDGEINHWGSILFVISKGDNLTGPVLDPLGAWPLWAPIGHAAPPGKPRRISAEYQIPADADALTLRIVAQSGIGPNTARVANLDFKILD